MISLSKPGEIFMVGSAFQSLTSNGSSYFDIFGISIPSSYNVQLEYQPNTRVPISPGSNFDVKKVTRARASSTREREMYDGLANRRLEPAQHALAIIIHDKDLPQTCKFS